VLDARRRPRALVPFQTSVGPGSCPGAGGDCLDHVFFESLGGESPRARADSIQPSPSPGRGGGLRSLNPLSLYSTRLPVTPRQAGSTVQDVCPSQLRPEGMVSYALPSLEAQKQVGGDPPTRRRYGRRD